MKKLFSLAGFLLLMNVPAALLAQDCKNSLPLTRGAEYEMKSFNEKDKLQSSTKSKVVDRKESGSSVEATINAESFDEKGKTMGTSSYTVKCDNGVFMVNMKTMLDPKTMEGYKDMDVKVEADNMEMPAANAAAGTTLKDAKLTMTINGPFTMTNTINITNRKVEGNEKITTPAGTFDCIKITYDVDMKFMVKVSSKVEEWYSPEVGTVMSKNYNSKGKLQGYTQLTSMKK